MKEADFEKFTEETKVFLDIAFKLKQNWGRIKDEDLTKEQQDIIKDMYIQQERMYRMLMDGWAYEDEMNEVESLLDEDYEHQHGDYWDE